MNVLQKAVAGIFRINTEKKNKRAYQSAQNIPYLSNWINSPTNPNVDIKQGLNSLRARSREAVQNSSYVRQFIRLYKSNIVGNDGFVLQSKTTLPSGKSDKASRLAIEKAWKKWGEYGSPDVTGTKTWMQIQNEFVQQVLMDGEYIAIEVPTKRNEFGFQLQVIDPMMLDISYSDTLKNGRYIKESIEYNSLGRPIAYHFIVANEETDHYTLHGRHYKRVDAKRVYHCFLSDFVNQRRGVPTVASALLRIGMLDGYTEAELVAARVGAATIGVWSDNKEGDSYTGESRDESGDFVSSAAPGDFIKAPNGAKLDIWDPTHPNSGYSQFTKDLLREISSGVGVGYSGLSNNYSEANYASMRLERLTEQDAWKPWQEWMISHFVKRVFTSFLKQSYALQKIKIGNVPLKHDIEGYLEHTWQPKRWAHVDPSKEEKANEMALSARTTSPQKIIRERGEDPDDVLDEWEEWFSQLEERNIKPSEEGFFLEQVNEKPNP